MSKAILALPCLFLAFGTLAAGQSKPDAPKTPPGSPPDASREVTGKVSPEEAASGIGVPVDAKTYRIGAEDILYIKVWREPEVSGPASVRPDGRITMPLIGEQKASGLTPEQLGADITKALSKFIVRPDVTVSLQSVQSKKYYITGEVNRTGAFPLVVPTTVLEALSGAGGFRDFANPKKIIIIRGAERLHFNYKEVVKGKNPQQNIFLENGDHLIVP